MESYFQAQVGGNMMRNRAVHNQKPGEIMVLYFISMNVEDENPGMEFYIRSLLADDIDAK
ncbi:hypothetical protein YDYSY3_37940 [Paenibacillus chitinolyticus]|nr:hypothetical protein YDYSY3_37940 [Paenibacillus chitinolyticus]